VTVKAFITLQKIYISTFYLSKHSKKIWSSTTVWHW